VLYVLSDRLIVLPCHVEHGHCAGGASDEEQTWGADSVQVNKSGVS
jgi:hypothetical protein